MSKTTVERELLERATDAAEHGTGIDNQDLIALRAILSAQPVEPPTVEYVGKNYGHGHVTPRPDGVKARCGGPTLCKVCRAEQRRQVKL